MKMALAVLTYDRAHYLSLVLPSILAQRIDGNPLSDHFDIYVFQDGFCSDDWRSSESGHREIVEMIGRLPPSIEVHRQPRNLGVALHFDFAEKLLFRKKKYDFVLFCEDDLLLGPQYVSVMKFLAEKFRGDDRVGMLSAHPSNPTRVQADQAVRLGDYAEIGHNWGFGLFREFWQKRQPFVELYLKLIADVPYRERPTQSVLEWLQMCGFNPNGSSQDYAKQCATAALGAARVSTFANFALPIGRHGLHSNSEVFERFGFGKTVVCEADYHESGDLTDERFEQILRSQQHTCIIDGDSFPSPAEWQGVVKSGKLDPKKLLAASAARTIELLSPTSRSWSSADIPRLPHMEPAGLEVLTERLGASQCFLEYGAGGSTVLAAETGVKTIYSVESDRSFLRAVKEAVAETATGATLVDHYVDIGPTVEWGNPRDSSKATSWPLYPSSIWNQIIARSGQQPDLVLVDGRFRVACFLATLLFAKAGTSILFDDYHDRPNYHVVEKYIAPVGRAGRMAEFRTSGPPPREAMLDLVAYSTNFA